MRSKRSLHIFPAGLASTPRGSGRHDPRAVRNLRNFLVFQAGWFACVLGAGNGLWWLGPAVALPALALHLSCTPDPRSESLLLVTATLLGTLADAIQAGLGLIAFPGAPLHLVWLPLWIPALWLLFATTFNASLLWVLRRPWLAALLGAAGGPLSYLAGERLAALRMGPDPRLSLAVLAITWAVLMPTLAWLRSELCPPREGAAPQPTGSARP